jgi:hypothetical protein
MSVYIDFLAEAIERTHNAKATHIESVPIREEFNGRTVWDGEVEVFDLEDHPNAGRCYAWGFESDDGTGKQAVAVLVLPPIDGPRRAVQAYIASLARNKK